MHTVSEHELNLSSRLNCLLGEHNAEISLLPNARTIHDWTTSEVLHAVCRCKDTLIDALRCALRLSQLGDLDEVSEQWIAETLRVSDVDQSLLELVEEDLVRECRPSLP